MAEPEARLLAQKITRDFLVCAICFEPFQDPRALPCQHGFCRDCLEQCLEASEDSHTLVCPTCRKAVTIAGGIEELPVHFLVSGLQDTVNMEKTVATPSPDTPCSNCNDPDKKAKVRCLDCKKYLCDTCHASHETLKTIMKDHRVVSMEDILSGKMKITEDEDKCKEHGQPYRYYCETEERSICQDCVILKKCPTEHDRVTLEEAVKNLSDNLNELLNKCSITIDKYQEAIQATRTVKSELESHIHLAKETLARLKKDYLNKVEEMFKEHEIEINMIQRKRINELDEKMTILESTKSDIQKAKEETTQVLQSGSKYEVISAKPKLSTRLQELSQSHPEEAACKTLGYIKFEAVTPVIPSIGKLLERNEGAPGEMWKMTGQFSTGELNRLQGLATNRDGDIAIASVAKGVKVFSRDGEVKCTLYDSPGSVDVDVTLDNKYVTTRIGNQQVQINDSQGHKLSTTPVTDVNNVKSGINSVAVDIKGRIVVGQVQKTISIHNADGSLISRFATQTRPYRLAVTSNGEIVSSFFDSEGKQSKDVQLMDYSGCNVRVIQPPAEVKRWNPSFVCCGQGEIFVVNRGTGNPTGVYRYTAEGSYLSCVTTEVRNPTGIALSQDGMELFVAQSTAEGPNLVKIFQRP